MARRNTKGFGSDNKYTTIFEKVSNATAGEKKSLAWYKGKVKQLAASYEETPEKMLRQEKRDARDLAQDENLLRKTVKEGHLYFFEYKAMSKWLPYYDKFPLVYVIKQDGEGFYGANLHYIKPKKRVKIIQKLERGLIDMPKTLVHKYLYNHCKSKFLDLAIEEWETSIFLPVEDFIMTKGSGRLPYDRELVWKETETKYDDRIKAQRIIKGYGKQSDKELVT